MRLQNRLTLITAWTLGLGLAAMCIAGNLLLSHTIASEIRGRLDARLDAIASSLSTTTGRIRVVNTITDGALDSYAWVYDPSGRVLEAASDGPALSALAAGLAREPGANRTRIAPGGLILGSRHLIADGHRLGTVVAETSVTTYDSLRQRVLLGSIAMALVTLSLAVLTVRRVLSAALAPVARMTEDAAEWGAHDLDRRFGLGPGRDEITALADTLDQLLERIASSRRHEQRFAAEVAHELRTPLATVRGTAELARNTRDLDEARQALAQIEDQSNRIAATLDTLVAFARRESTPAADGVDLGAVASEFPGVSVLGGPVPRVEGDPALIRQMLAPLIENANRYAQSSVKVELAVRAGRVVAAVRDDGSGIDPELGDRVFLPGVRGSSDTGDGAGLGLPLARRLAHSCGGEVKLGDGPGGCVLLMLPAYELSEAAL